MLYIEPDKPLLSQREICIHSLYTTRNIQVQYLHNNIDTQHSYLCPWSHSYTHTHIIYTHRWIWMCLWQTGSELCHVFHFEECNSASVIVINRCHVWDCFYVFICGEEGFHTADLETEYDPNPVWGHVRFPLVLLSAHHSETQRYLHSLHVAAQRHTRPTTNI